MEMKEATQVLTEQSKEIRRLQRQVHFWKKIAKDGNKLISEWEEIYKYEISKTWLRRIVDWLLCPKAKRRINGHSTS